MVVGLIALTLGAAVFLTATRELNARSPEVPVTVGARMESRSGDTVVLKIGGPVGPGKLGGTTMIGRITPDTRFEGLRRNDMVGPTVPLEVTFDNRPNADGSYRLIAIVAVVR